MQKDQMNGQPFSEAVNKAKEGDVILWDEANEYVHNLGNKEKAKLMAIIELMKRKGRFYSGHLVDINSKENKRHGSASLEGAK